MNELLDRDQTIETLIELTNRLDIKNDKLELEDKSTSLTIV